MSWYNQHVKWPFDRRKSRMDPQAFLATIADFHWLDYWALVGRWQAVLGPGRVAVAILEPGQVEDVTGDFLDRLGLGPRRALEPGLSDERTNDSLPVHLLEIARSLELFDMRPGQRMRVLNALRAGLADKASPARDGLFARGARRHPRPLRRVQPPARPGGLRPRGAVSRAAAGAGRRLLPLSRPAPRDPARRLDRAGGPRAAEPALRAARVALASPHLLGGSARPALGRGRPPVADGPVSPR